MKDWKHVTITRDIVREEDSLVRKMKIRKEWTREKEEN